MDQESTHFIFDEEKAVISPNLYPIVLFLQEIEKEVDSFLKYEDRLTSISNQYIEMLEFVQFLSNKLKENNLDFKYRFIEKPETIAEKLKIERPVRAEMIVLFANLEVLFCINNAYKNKTEDENVIRKLGTDQEVVKSFLQSYCLNSENLWGKNNPERLKHITPEQLRRLRNSLTHFFSVSSGLSISHPHQEDKARRLEETIEHKASFLSTKDLQEILKGAAILMMREWSKDYLDSVKDNHYDFKERIMCVKSIVEKNGAIVIKNNQIDI